MNARKFRLEPVLELKDRQEDELQQELADIQRLHRQAEEELARRCAVRQQHMDDLRSWQSGGAGLETIRQGFLYLESLTAAAEVQERQVQEFGDRVEAKRQELLAVMQEKKAIEKLKEKHLQRAAERERQAETKTNEESALTRFHQGAPK